MELNQPSGNAAASERLGKGPKNPKNLLPALAKYRNHPLRSRDLAFCQADDQRDLEEELKAVGFFRVEA